MFTGDLVFISLKSLRRGGSGRQPEKAGIPNFLINPLIPKTRSACLFPCDSAELTEQRTKQQQSPCPQLELLADANGTLMQAFDCSPLLRFASRLAVLMPRTYSEVASLAHLPLAPSLSSQL